MPRSWIFSRSTLTCFSSGWYRSEPASLMTWIARREVAELLRERADLLVVDVELHARLRPADLDARAFAGRSPSVKVGRRVLARLDRRRPAIGRRVVARRRATFTSCGPVLTWSTMHGAVSHCFVPSTKISTRAGAEPFASATLIAMRPVLGSATYTTIAAASAAHTAAVPMSPVRDDDGRTSCVASIRAAIAALMIGGSCGCDAACA